MNVKKRLILYLPYLVIGLYAGKLPQAWRMAAGANASEKLLNIMGSIHSFKKLCSNQYFDRVLVLFRRKAFLEVKETKIFG